MSAILARKASVALLAGLISVSAIGQTPAQKVDKAQDPSQERVCEKLEVIGSRIATKRVCMTRAEWADARLQDRQAVERMQTHRGLKGE